MKIYNLILYAFLQATFFSTHPQCCLAFSWIGLQMFLIKPSLHILYLVYFCPTWDCFRLSFSFSCSGYDLTLIKKSRTLNCHSFLQKFLLNSLLVTVIAQFTAKITNSEKAVYFLSLMSCSINTLQSHMFFTCKRKDEKKKDFYLTTCHEKFAF